MIFDFGDEWRFDCKVLRIETGKQDDYVEILCEVGEPPLQYSDYDE